MTRLERQPDGDLVEVEDESHPVDCTGWRGEDWQGRPIPCVVCRDALVEKLRRQRRHDWDGTQ